MTVVTAALVECVADAVEDYIIDPDGIRLKSEQRDTAVDVALAALAAVEAAGYKIVPMIPTKEMLRWAVETDYLASPRVRRIKAEWRRLLAAAPSWID